MLSVVALGSAVLGNTISITSNDVRGGNLGFDNIKADWSKSVDIGGNDADLTVEYDRSASESGLKTVSLAGVLSEDKDMTVSYEVEHDFTADSTDVSLTAVSGDTTFGAEYDVDAGEITEFSAQKDLDIGGSDIDTTVTWKVADSNARVKMITAMGDATVTGEFTYNDGDVSDLEIGYDTNLEAGRDLSISYTDDEVEIEVTDTNFEDDATWTATATLKHPELDLDDMTITLKRSWEW